jgi:hypothetical protein
MGRLQPDGLLLGKVQQCVLVHRPRSRHSAAMHQTLQQRAHECCARADSGRQHDKTAMRCVAQQPSSLSSPVVETPHPGLNISPTQAHTAHSKHPTGQPAHSVRIAPSTHTASSAHTAHNKGYNTAAVVLSAHLGVCKPCALPVLLFHPQANHRPDDGGTGEGCVCLFALLRKVDPLLAVNEHLQPTNQG